MNHVPTDPAALFAKAFAEDKHPRDHGKFARQERRAAKLTAHRDKSQQSTEDHVSAVAQTARGPALTALAHAAPHAVHAAKAGTRAEMARHVVAAGKAADTGASEELEGLAQRLAKGAHPDLADDIRDRVRDALKSDHGEAFGELADAIKDGELSRPEAVQALHALLAKTADPSHHATELAEQLGVPGDDHGSLVDALGDWPGVETDRADAGSVAADYRAAGVPVPDPAPGEHGIDYGERDDVQAALEQARHAVAERAVRAAWARSGLDHKEGAIGRTENDLLTAKVRKQPHPVHDHPAVQRLRAAGIHPDVLNNRFLAEIHHNKPEALGMVDALIASAQQHKAFSEDKVKRDHGQFASKPGAGGESAAPRGPAGVWHAFTSEPDPVAKDYLASALHNAGAHDPESRTKLPKGIDPHKLAERLASVYQQAHEEGRHEVADKVAAALAHVGGAVPHAAGDTVAFDGLLHTSDDSLFTGDAATVVTPGVYAADGRELARAKVRASGGVAKSLFAALAARYGAVDPLAALLASEPVVKGVPKGAADIVAVIRDLEPDDLDGLRVEWHPDGPKVWVDQMDWHEGVGGKAVIAAAEEATGEEAQEGYKHKGDLPNGCGVYLFNEGPKPPGDGWIDLLRLARPELYSKALPGDKPTAAVDLDGTLAEYDGWKGAEHFGEPLEGAKEFLDELSQTHRVLIFTTRTKDDDPALMRGNAQNRHALAALVRGWLDRNELPYDDVYIGQGKPIADVYVDDRAVAVPPNPAPDDYAAALDAIRERSSVAKSLFAALADRYDDAVFKGGKHAPPGGIDLAGKRFEGGWFIPASDIKSATKAEKKELKDRTAAAHKDTHKTKVSRAEVARQAHADAVANGAPDDHVALLHENANAAEKEAGIEKEEGKPDDAPEIRGFHTLMNRPTGFQQRGKGTYIALDTPFNPGQGKVAHAAVKNIHPHQILDTDGVYPGSDPEKSRRDEDEVNEKVNAMSDEEAYSLGRPADMVRKLLRDKGYRSEVGWIEPGIPSHGRELVVWDKENAEIHHPGLAGASATIADAPSETPGDNAVSAPKSPRAVAGTVDLDGTHKLASTLHTLTGERKKAALAKLADRLQGHTSAELKTLKERLGIRASGPKAELARKLAERAANPDKSSLREYAPTGGRLTVDEAHELISGHLDSGRMGDPKVRREVADAIEGRMTVKDLHELKARLGLKASGPKYELAKKIADRAKAKEPLPKTVQVKIKKQRGRSSSDSVIQAVIDFGGIDPKKYDFQKFYATHRDAINDGIPLQVFRSGGADLEEIAKQLHGDGNGLVPTPHGKDPSEHLLDQIRQRAHTTAADLSSKYDEALNEHWRLEQDAHDAGHAPDRIAEAARLGQEAGASEGAAGLVGEDREGAVYGHPEETGGGISWDDEPAEHFEPDPYDHALANHSPHLEDIDRGSSGYVGGHLVRRTQEGQFQVETPTGYKVLSRAEASAHINAAWTKQSRERNAVTAALARADSHEEPDPFTNPVESREAAARRGEIPDGARGVSLDAHTRGRTGIVKRDAATGATRLVLDGGEEAKAQNFEPLHAGHSWRTPHLAQAAAQRSVQGSLFDEPEAVAPAPVPKSPSGMDKYTREKEKAGVAEARARAKAESAHAAELFSNEQDNLFNAPDDSPADAIPVDPEAGASSATATADTPAMQTALTAEASSVLAQLAPGKHFADMTATEARDRLTHLNTVLGSRAVTEATQYPRRYNAVSRMEEPADPAAVARHEQATAAAQRAHQEREDVRGRLSHLENEERRQKERAADLERNPLHERTRDDYAANGGRDKTKRAQGIRAAEHRAAVADALAAGKPVPDHVLADYPDLAPPLPATPSARGLHTLPALASEPVGAATGGGKQPHEMTRAEFDAQIHAHGAKAGAAAGIDASGFKKGEFAPPGQVPRGVDYGWDRAGLNLGQVRALQAGGTIPVERHGSVYFARAATAGETADGPRGLKIVGKLPYADAVADPHKAFVQAAVARGDSVPSEVLADYPDLAPTASPAHPSPLHALAAHAHDPVALAAHANALRDLANKPSSQGGSLAFHDAVSAAMRGEHGDAIRDAVNAATDDWKSHGGDTAKRYARVAQEVAKVTGGGVPATTALARVPATAPAPTSNAPPNTVGMAVRDYGGAQIGWITEPHDGTPDGMRAAADTLTERAHNEYPEFSNAGSHTAATDANGRVSHAISPNRNHVNEVGTDEAAYTWGDLSKAPKAPKPIKAKDPNAPKVEYVRAPAGGKVSEVDGIFYRGGRLMPIHGKYSGMEKPPKGDGIGADSGPTDPNSDGGEGGGGKGSRPLSADDLATAQRKHAEESKWDEMNRGVLGQLTWLGNKPNSKAGKGVDLKKWKEFAEKHGEEKMKAIIDAVKPAMHAKYDANPELPEENREWAKGEPHRQAETDAQMFAGSKKHLKQVPSSYLARQHIQQHMEDFPGADGFHALEQKLSAVVNSPAVSSTPARPSPASATSPALAGSVPTAGALAHTGDWSEPEQNATNVGNGIDTPTSVGNNASVPATSAGGAQGGGKMESPHYAEGVAALRSSEAKSGDRYAGTYFKPEVAAALVAAGLLEPTLKRGKPTGGYQATEKVSAIPAPAPTGHTLDLTRGRQAMGRAYLARLTGPDSEYGFSRSFLSPQQVPGAGERQHRYSELEEGVYESQGYADKTGGRLYHQITRNPDGTHADREITEDEARALVGYRKPVTRPTDSSEAPDDPLERMEWEAVRRNDNRLEQG